MRLLTPDDEPLTSEVLTQTLAMLALWGPLLSRALDASLGDASILANLTQDLALALVEAQEAEQEDEPTATYQPPTPDPAIELMATLAQVNAHTTARQQLIELANQEGMDDD
jgi:hypothetical protein